MYYTSGCDILKFVIMKKCVCVGWRVLSLWRELPKISVQQAKCGEGSIYKEFY